MNLQHAIQSIHASIDEMVHIAQGLPAETIRQKPAEDKWSILEIVCHVEEAVPYWLNEIGKLLERPGSEWGRGLQDEARLNAVAQADSQSFPLVLQSLKNVKDQVAQVLGGLTDSQLATESPSRNPRFGVKPLSFIVDHLLVEHVAKHVGQIQRNIRELNEANS